MITPPTSLNSIPLHSVKASAPLRVLDNGGWTDTWFARHGAVFNIAIEPCVDVRLDVFERSPSEEQSIVVSSTHAEEYSLTPGKGSWGREPLIEAAIFDIGIPVAYSVRVSINSRIPAGASTGTSASATVALVAALFSLQQKSPTPHELAMRAHHIEMDVLGWQCGIQDQLCAAYGGLNFITMTRFPDASVEQLVPSRVFSDTLERSLLLLFFGSSHRSSDVHERVIAECESVAGRESTLDVLRQCAARARDSVLGEDIHALGASMIANTEAQRQLHPQLISSDAQRAIDVAKQIGAIGWKVNGAGGDGGSMILLVDELKKDLLQREIERLDEKFSFIPIRLARSGVTVEKEINHY